MIAEGPSLKPHPAAELFPMMSDAELDALAADIKENGLREAIVLHEDMILDGRNRYDAWQRAYPERADIEPKPLNWEGEDPVAFVLSKNLHRRHLNESQRSMIAGRLANMPQGARTDLSSIDGMSQENAARLMQISESSVGRAVKVLKRGDLKIINAVDREGLPVSAAAAIAGLREEDRTKVVAEPVTEWRKALRDMKPARKSTKHAPGAEPTDDAAQPKTAEGSETQAPKTGNTPTSDAQAPEAGDAQVAGAATPHNSGYVQIIEILRRLQAIADSVHGAGGIDGVVAGRPVDDERALDDLLARVCDTLGGWRKQLKVEDATDDR